MGVVLLRAKAFQVFFGEYVSRQSSGVLFQKRLVIERLQLTCAADHEQEDDALGPGSEVWLPGRKRLAEVSRRTARRLVRQQAGQSDATQAQFLEEPTAVPSNRLSSVSCVSEHR